MVREGHSSSNSPDYRATIACHDGSWNAMNQGKGGDIVKMRALRVFTRSLGLARALPFFLSRVPVGVLSPVFCKEPIQLCRLPTQWRSSGDGGR